MNSTANLNTSILVAALEKNKPEIVKLLIERGADPNQATSDKEETPLHITARLLNKTVTEKMYRNIVRQLLVHKADPTRKNAKGLTPLEAEPKWRDFLRQ